MVETASCKISGKLNEGDHIWKMRAVNYKDEDFLKPIITVACPYSNALPCNGRLYCFTDASAHIRTMGDLVMEQIVKEGGKTVTFGTPVISDGVTMGAEVYISHNVHFT